MQTTDVLLVRPTEAEARLIADWSRSVEEARQWCSRAEHPFPWTAVVQWWTGVDVQPWLLVNRSTSRRLAYGELWHDVEEDEVELARLIVDPNRRRRGVGRLLVASLVTEARTSGLGSCCLRVDPDNGAALRLYRSTGFHDVDRDRTAAWNRGQPTDYVWLERSDFG